MIELTAADGHKFSAYRADPAGTPKGAVVVLQQIYGVDAQLRTVADGFAAEGYVAIAPALFDRVQPGIELARDEAGLTKGLELLGQIPLEKTLADVQAAVTAASAAGKVALVGYSWGAHIAYQAANAVPGLAVVVGYYGGGIADEWRGKRRVPTLLHFGTGDEQIPFERVTQFRMARPDVSIFDYPAGHGFDIEGTPAYHPEAAQLARERTLTVISQHVVGQPPVALKNAGSYAQAKADKKKKPKASSDDMGPPAE